MRVFHSHREPVDVDRFDYYGNGDRCQDRAQGGPADGDYLPMGGYNRNGDEETEGREEAELLPGREM
jgi:hypothetical protein